MTNEQEQIFKKFVKQFLYAALPPVEAESAVSSFETTLASKGANREAYLYSLFRLFQTQPFLSIINTL